MALTREDQLRIMREDRLRRHLREQAEIEQFVQAHTPTPRGTRNVVVNRELVRGIGVISPPLRVRVSESSWERQLHTRHVGVAPGTEPTATESTVLVTHADGTSEIRPVTSFRRTRNVSRRARVAQATQPETARVSHGHNFAAE
jgi:hypothetical protein